MEIKDEWDMQNLLRNKEIEEKEIIEQLKNCPDEIRKSGDVFLTAVFWDRLETAKEMVKLGVDVQYKDKGSLYRGNALSAVHSEEMAEWLLSLGLEVEKNLSVHISHDYVNPIIPTIMQNRNRTNMIFYWLKKETEMFAGEKQYLSELYTVAVQHIVMVNQADMLSEMMRDDFIYEKMQEIYAAMDSLESIKLSQSALRRITDASLEDRKKVIRKLLNDRKKELTGETVLKKFSAKKFGELFAEGVIPAIQTVNEMAEGDIYIYSISIAADKAGVYLYYNTEQYYQGSVADQTEEGDDFYYRYCEDEWSDAVNCTECFEKAIKYLRGCEESYDMDALYKAIPGAMKALKEKNASYNELMQDKILTVYGHDDLDERDFVSIVKKLNGGAEIKDYIKNLEYLY